ncbi:MAG: TerB family tellurite resistance protein [Robiginitomaculum sp.]|nr:TerB family tellurite resistance protein [Robiginitomaculum sp.]
MTMLIGLLTIIGGIAALMWKISLGIQAAKQIGGVAKQVANLPRKMKFRSQTGKADVQLITDPREAAALLMLSVARAGGQVTKSQKDTILNQITGHFKLSTTNAEELLTHISWLSKDLPGADSAIAKMSDTLMQSVSNKELIELEDMLMQVAHADGKPTSAQKQILNQFAKQVGI